MDPRDQPRDQPRDPRGPPPDQRFGAPSGPRDPRSERGAPGPPGPPNDGRFSGPVHSPQQQWGPNQGGPPPRGPPGENNVLKDCYIKCVYLTYQT